MSGDDDKNEKPEPEAQGEGAPAGGAFQLPDGFSNQDTAGLVKRAQDGDAQALNDLFTRYHSLMVEIARRRLGPRLRLKEDPDDLAQTTFREATRDFKRYEYRGEQSLLKWLIQILQNKIRDKAEYYSASKRDSSLETALEAPVDPERDFAPRIEPSNDALSVTRHVQLDERFELLRKALEQLNPEYRQAIALVFFEGLSLREAGKRMGGRTEDALRMMLRRAEAKLHEILKGSLGKDFKDTNFPYYR
ncbi:MAG: sigma-70 family RNA polymerase sigma factor [Planctomycetes bacterium]|nr:sigma-70 family RNA polymerase sigma factor [Planctomycetota bacterium]